MRIVTVALLLLALLSASGALPPPPGTVNGVNFGGWLLTEPSWMYDKFSAPAEGDLVRALRAQGGDAFAVQTMRNHWAGYIPEAALALCSALGVTQVRIPVPYWIIEAPVVPVALPGQPPPKYAYGFNHEGFVTGGLNHLEDMLARLKARGISALVDLHAMPGGSSACQSYAGWQVATPGFWRGSPPADAATPIPSGCGGGGAGPYYSSRGAARTWRAVGEDALQALGAWVVGLQANESLAGAVVGLEVVNEPGCCVSGWQADIEAFTEAAVPPLQRLLSAGGSSAKVVLNFLGPNDNGAGAWVGERVRSGAFNGSALLIDYHNYLNWSGDLSWAQLAARVCGAASAQAAPWAQYAAAGLPVLVGEWSLSSNLGAAAFTDLGNASTRARLATFYANQMSLYSAARSAVGQHHWALRMGSGWDPRPAPSAPSGAQAPGSAWDASLPGFWPAVWSLGELARVGVAVPLADLAVTGVCECRGCSAEG